MPDDEPLDDARAVGMAGAAAVAKVVETAARAAANHRDRQPSHLDQATERRLDELTAAERWAASQNPDRLHHYYAERDGALSGARVDIDRLTSAESSLVEDWRRANGPRDNPRDSKTRDAAETGAQGYDSAERRTGSDSAMKAAGVADEPRKARVTSDLLNAADPRTAAGAGKSTRAAAAAPTPRAPEQARSR